MKYPIIVSCLLIAGCRGAYKAPDVKINDQFINSTAALNETEFNPKFWEALNDSVLNRLVELLETQNYDLAIAEEKISELRAQYRFQTSQLFPQIGGTGSIKRERDTQTLTFSQFTGTVFQTQYALGFDASWELDFFGAQQAAKQSAFFTMMSQKEKASYVKLSLTAELCLQYVNLRTEQALIQAYKKELSLLKEIDLLSATRFSAGLNDQTDTLFNLARVQDKEALIEKKQADVDKLIFLISQLVGQFPDKEYETLKQYCPLDATIPLIYDKLPSFLILSRPDVAASRYELFSNQALLRKAYRDFFPQFNITSAYGVLSNFPNLLFKKQSLQWNIMPGFSVSLIDFGALIAEKNVAKSREKQALLSYENSLIKAFNEIETSLSGVKNTDLQIQSLEDELISLHEKTIDFQERYRCGLIAKNPYLESSLEEVLVEQSLINAVSNRFGFAIAFYKAIGTRL